MPLFFIQLKRLLRVIYGHTLTAQTGIASIILLFLLILAIGFGSYLIRQNTNFLPFAKVNDQSGNQAMIKVDEKLGVRVIDSLRFEDLLKLGVSRVRFSVESADMFYQQDTIEKANFAYAQSLFSYVKAHNMQLVILIKPGSPVSLGDMQSRIDLLSSALGGYQNVVFELGNEPDAKNSNGDPFWNGDMTSFAQFVADTSSIIRNKWPNPTIIIGSLDLQGRINSTSEEVAKSAFSDYLDVLGSKVDLKHYAFSMHSYSNADWFERIFGIEQAELNKRGLTGDIWLTETGVNLQAGDDPNALAQIIRAAESKPEIKGIFIHAFDSLDGYALWDISQNKATPNYQVVQNYIQQNGANSIFVLPPAGSSSGTAPTGTVSAADKSCADNPIAPPSDNLVWHAFCQEADYASGHFSCASNTDCPQNTIQTSSGIEATTSNQCVQFKEGSRCIQLRLLKSDSGQNLYDPVDPAFDTPNDTFIKNPANIPFGRVGLGQSSGKEGDNQGPRSDFALFISSFQKMLNRIKEDARVKQLLGDQLNSEQDGLVDTAEKATVAAKNANDAWLQDKSNSDLAKQASDATKTAADAVTAAEAIRKLAKLEQILQGQVAQNCVKADLGIRPWLEARRLKARGEDTKEDGTAGEKTNRYLRLYVCSGKDPNDLKWRVATDGNDNDPTDAATASMERILHLHGDSADAPYPTPQYPFSEIQGGYVTLTGQSADAIRSSLQKYIEAAKNGKAVVE